MAQGGNNSKAYIIGGLVIVVAVIAYFVYGDGMAMLDGETDSVTVESGETTTDGTDGAEAPAETEGGTTAPADDN
ncbi:hypothetical protein G5B40_06530 [Pikeienuella piscinae]|uniref:Uncharacterized protein n=1 Tax=Pikeienuella piscinae TaxID=2748098 RepID=A0A7L5BUB5_9RHOB|nr:hypothetical protein [Pikeienuella piscinae]QIE53957.1 hypothetical protein G5B40_06530 [Pikeienuella piscinae]